MTTILAIDQGTTGTTSIVYRFEGTDAHELGRGYQEITQYFPRPGWVEHNLGNIWESVRTSCQQALKSAGIEASSLEGIGITNQRETLGFWEHDEGRGAPLAPAIVWQDRRTHARCQELSAFKEEISQQSGLLPDPYFSGTKIAWLLEEHPEWRPRLESKALRLGTIDTWLMDRLSGGTVYATDVSNASRTLLMDLHDCSWSTSLRDRICPDLPLESLPTIVSNAGELGHTVDLGFLPAGIPIAGVAGDQQAALFGQGCLEPGQAKCTYGTGAFLLLNTGAQAPRSQHALLTTVAWRLGEETTYALEGSAFVAGSAVQWLRDGLGIIQKSSEVEALAAEVSDSGEVVFVPALSGLGAPHWRADVRGQLSGITRGTTKAHIARATLEGIAFQVADLLAAMNADAPAELSALQVDGGAAANGLMMQFQADIIQRPVRRPRNLESTALGAAKLALLGVGGASLHALGKELAQDREFIPKASPAEAQAHMARWQGAVDRLTQS